MNNPSAFPEIKTDLSHEGSQRDGDYRSFSDTYSVGGMTLLDYFAGQALTALDITPYSSMKHIADYAYRLAEAMLEERQKCLANLTQSASE